MTLYQSGNYTAGLELFCSKYINDNSDYIIFAEYIASNLSKALGLEFIKWDLEDIIYDRKVYLCKFKNPTFKNCVYVSSIQINPPIIYINIFSNNLEKLWENNNKIIFECIGEFEVNEKKFITSSFNTQILKGIDNRFCIQNKDGTSYFNYMKYNDIYSIQKKRSQSYFYYIANDA